MSERGTDDHLGLPWPDAYRELQPLLRAQWGVGDDIYLLHQLSGKSGAMVYAADIQTSDFSGQAILKLERSPNPEWQEKTEADRHRHAIDLQPDYAAEHLPRILHTLNSRDSLAILSSIAGRGLKYAKPWAECPHDVQLGVTAQVSRGLLEDWNPGSGLAKGLVLPRDILAGWLGYRLDPKEGRLHGFLEGCGLAAAEPSVIFEGQWYPNPLAFALAPAEDLDRQRQRAVVGNVHGDLHGYNVLVRTAATERPAYYLIDLALFQDHQYLFYDHAYLEFSHLLMMREHADAATWSALLGRLGAFDHPGAAAPLKGDDVGLLELVGGLRREVAEWIDRHQANRLSYMEGQYLLARVAVGLNFANKPLPDRSRRMALLYAAANLKDFLRLDEIDWPKHGPAFGFDAAPPAADTAGAAPEPGHPSLPDRPAVAVLAFENLSGDPGQEHLADGMAQEIITALSHTDWLMVIARGSSFAYKGQIIDVKRIGRELGVHYVVEGSVRRAGDRVRVSVQLISALNSHHLWAERFDRRVDDIFELQEEIARTIAANIDARLKFAERKRARHLGPRPGIWLEYQHALWDFFRVTDRGPEVALEHLADIVAKAPDFADPHALIAIIHCRRITLLESDDPEADLRPAFEHADRAVSLEDTSSLARIALSRVLMLQGKYDEGIDEARVAVEANPNSSVGHLCLAMALFWSGRAEEALPAVDTTIRLSPKGPYLRFKLICRAVCLYVLGRPDEAEAAARQVIHDRMIGPLGPLALAAALAQQGRADEAGVPIAEMLRHWPDVSLSRLQSSWKHVAPDYLAMLVRDLKAAGLPEQ